MWRPSKHRSPASSGFTLVETMVALAIFGLIGAAVYGVMIHTNRSERVGSTLAEAQQNARAGLDIILRDLRQAGYGIGSPENAVSNNVPIETASEYRITFNIDRDLDGNIEPGERVTYFLDNDATDPIVAATGNPDDYVLRRVISTAIDSMADPGTRKGEMVAYGITQRTPGHSGWNVRLFNYYAANGASLLGPNNDPAGTQYGRTVPDSALGKPVGIGLEDAIRSVRAELVAEASQRHPETHQYPRVQVSGTIHPRNLGLLASAGTWQTAPPYTGTGTGTGTGTATGTGTGTGTATGTATGTGTALGLPTYEPPIRIATGRVLSLVAADLHERDSLEGSQVTQDHQHDYDLIMGTVLGTDNLSIWYEGYPSRYSGDRLYPASPSYRGRSTHDVYALASGNLDTSSTDYSDLAAAVALTATTGGIEIWLNQGVLAEGRVGLGTPPTIPNGYYSSGSGSGRSIAVGDMDSDGLNDVVLGTRTGANNGAIEVWHNTGLGILTFGRRLSASGEVLTIATADFDGDGWQDIAAGTKTSSNDQTGRVEVWINLHNGNFNRHGPWNSGGRVTSIATGRMDSDTDIDLVAGTQTGHSSGQVELWLNSGNGDMAIGDVADADGIVGAVGVGLLDYMNDGLDIAAGNSSRSVQAWFCNPNANSPSGIIPTNNSWRDANSGGVVNALTIKKLEAPRDNQSIDPLGDIVVGTAITASTGELVVYLNPYVQTLNP